MKTMRWILLAVTCALFASASQRIFAADDYQLGPDSMVQEGVPQGKIIEGKHSSTVFAETVRNYSIYVPAQYD